MIILLIFFAGTITGSIVTLFAVSLCKISKTCESGSWISLIKYLESTEPRYDPCPYMFKDDLCCYEGEEYWCDHTFKIR